MNKLFISGSFLLIIFISSCKSHNTAVNNTIVDTTRFLPVMDFIASDIKDVKSTPYFIYKIRTLDKKKDSTNLSVADFELFAHSFLQFDITKAPLKSQFRESTFHDNTTKSNTFIYTPLNATAEIRNITVLLDESTDRPKNIFIQTIKQIKDTSIIERLQWKPRKSFRITTITQAKGYNREESNYVSWNEVSN